MARPRMRTTKTMAKDTTAKQPTEVKRITPELREMDEHFRGMMALAGVKPDLIGKMPAVEDLAAFGSPDTWDMWLPQMVDCVLGSLSPAGRLRALGAVLDVAAQERGAEQRKRKAG